MLSRIQWIDLAKGFTLLLVIMGHSISEGIYGGLFRGIIFSFHMPLFFILSGATYRCSKTTEEYKKKLLSSAKHLLVPAISLFFCICLVFQYRYFHSLGDFTFWRAKLFTLLFASGVSVSYNGFNVDGIGIPWFFFALFSARAMFDFIHFKYNDDSKIFLSCCILGMIGVLFGRIQWMPFSLDIALAVLPFLFFGYQMKNWNFTKYSFRRLFAWGGTWFLTFIVTFTSVSNWTYMELAIRRYTLFPICYITAIAGTMVLCEGSIMLCQWKRIAVPFVFIGKHSIYLLCIHIVDDWWHKWWFVPDNQFHTAIQRMLIDVIIFFLFMLAKKMFETCQKPTVKN